MHSIVQSIVKSVVWLLHAIYMQGYLDGHVMQCRAENNNVKPIFSCYHFSIVTFQPKHWFHYRKKLSENPLENLLENTFTP